jgi:hypothetical protein
MAGASASSACSALFSMGRGACAYRRGSCRYPAYCADSHCRDKVAQLTGAATSARKPSQSSRSAPSVKTLK